SLTSSFLTERFAVEADGSDEDFELSPPKLEKFHFPDGDCRRRISGVSRVRSVTLSCLDRIRGISSTPTLKLLAVTKGSLLNAGSSAMARFSAETLAARRDKPRLPTLTSRPSALLNSDSSRGRKLLTLIKNGRAITATRIIA